MAPAMAKSSDKLDEFTGEGGWSGLGLAVVALVTLGIALVLLYIASPNVNPH
jgi:hypothetical protein